MTHESAEVGIDSAKLAEMRRIEQVILDAIDVVETLEVDAGGSDVAEFDDPVFGELVIDVQEPALAVLRLDGWIDDEACDLQTRHSALRIQTARELRGIEGDRDVVQDLGPDALGGAEHALDGVGR